MPSAAPELSQPAVGTAVAAAAGVPGAPRRATPRKGRWFYIGVGLVAVAISIVAFAPSIANQSGRRGPLTPVVMAHALAMSAWLALFLGQTWLVATRRLALHMRLGMASIAIAVAIVVTGYMAAVAMARRGFDLSGDLSRPPNVAMDQTVFQFGAVVIFAVLVGIALLLRRRPAAHKRLMTLALIQTLMAAPLAHLVGHFQLPGVILPAWGLAVALTLIVHDRRTLGRVHPASLWGGLGLVVVNNLQALVIGPSQTWQRVVTWLAS